MHFLTNTENELHSCRHLREHQQEGVRFLYDSIVGVRTSGFTGCILADDMGLGCDETLDASAHLTPT